MTMAKEKKYPLTLKQENFARFYVDTGNASEAYRMAYDAEGMKPESVWTNASILLGNAKVAQRVKELQKEYQESRVVSREKVEQILMDIIETDPSDLYYADKNTGKIKMKSPSQLPKRVRNALKSISNNKGVVKYEFNGKTEAARLLGSWHGWNAPTEVKVGGTGPNDEIRIGFDDEEEN